MAEIKNKVSIEVVKGERIYSLICDSESPLGELFDALQNIQNFVIEKINSSKPQITEFHPNVEVSETPAKEEDNG